MVKFNEDHKKEVNMNYFEIGVHQVQIMLIEFGETEDGKEFVEFTVTDPGTNTKEAKARLWFTTEKAIGYTFGIMRGLFTHNAQKGKEEEIKKQVNAVKDTAELEKLCEVLIGKEAFLEISEDPNRTYTDKDGNTKPSLNRNIYGYKPAPKTVSAPAETTNDPAPSDEDAPMAGF